MSDASRAVLASDVTPASISAWSGTAEIVASPFTEIAGGGTVCARAGDAASVSAARAMSCFIRFTSLQWHVDVDHQLILRGLQRIGGVFFDKGVLGLKFLVVEVVGDRLVGVVHVVVGAAVDELQRLAIRRIA